MKNKNNTECIVFWIPGMKLYFTMWVVLLCLSNTIDMEWKYAAPQGTPQYLKLRDNRTLVAYLTNHVEL